MSEGLLVPKSFLRRTFKYISSSEIDIGRSYRDVGASENTTNAAPQKTLLWQSPEK